MQINQTTKEIVISVSEIAADSQVTAGGGLAAISARLSAGRKVHREYQQQQLQTQENYRKEVVVDFRICLDEYTFRIQGRIDGVLAMPQTTMVEEIKSVILAPAEFDLLDAASYSRYTNQLRIYCYLLEMMHYPAVSGRLIFVNLFDQAQRVTEIRYAREEIAQFIEHRLRGIVTQLQIMNQWRQHRQEMGARLEFPYPTIREFQHQMLQDLKAALDAPQNILLSAPTGIGKTAAALYASLKVALQTNRYLFYVTSKTTQQQIVQQTINQMNRQPGITIRAITLAAREKLCLNDVLWCQPEFCPFLENYFRKSASSHIYAELLALGNVTPTDVLNINRPYQFCPFEVSLDLSQLADVIVGDYNYVFDPQVYLRRFFDDPPAADYLLILDEAHNLYARGRDYYSPELNWDDVQTVIYECQKYSQPIYAALKQLYFKIDHYFNALKQDLEPQLPAHRKMLFEPDPEWFQDTRAEFDERMLEYFIFKKINHHQVPHDPIDDFYYRFTRFENTLACRGDEFAYIYNHQSDNIALKILCLDPARLLKARLDCFDATIAMSATLEPMTFYRDVLGFDPDTLLVSYPSPFPARHRKIVVAPLVSTRYEHRSQAYAPIAEIIQQIIALKRGNYFAFFPSFDFLNQVAGHLYLNDVLVLRQTQNMSEAERQKVLSQLRAGQESCLVLAVQGGIFAEGVDYPGQMLIGALIIGPGLPAYNFEQELLKQYYQQKYESGFEYAYLYPGMNRVIQSAGRVIRTPQDKGIIVLIDQRFATEYYQALFPTHWYQESPRELVSEDFLPEIEQFWAEIGPE
ncbi:ATP-dependent DNA helicase [candidate division KSB1 bacterium]|nr:ATP-dependent DNA helicase [candidate division KSB1 bacterium]